MSIDRDTSRVRAALLMIVTIAALSGIKEAPSRADPANHVCAPAEAKTQFEQGTQLIDKGDWSAGCAKIEASMTQCPATSAQINIARCHAHDGKLAQALADYEKALVLNRETPKPERRRALEDVATKELAEVTKRVPTLKITVRERRPDLMDLMITRDGALLPANLLGEPIPVDVGKHVVIASATGFQLDRHEVQVAESTNAEVEIVLAPISEAPAPPPVEPGAQGCGSCHIARGSGGPTSLLNTVLAALLLLLRRRRWQSGGGARNGAPRVRQRREPPPSSQRAA